MAVGSLALWIAVPAGWLWVTRGLEAGPRFVLAITGSVASMAGGAWVLYRLEAVYLRAAGEVERRSFHPSWTQTASESNEHRPALSLLDRFLVASAVVALVALVVWWTLLADSPNPSGPLQPL